MLNVRYKDTNWSCSLHADEDNDLTIYYKQDCGDHGSFLINADFLVLVAQLYEKKRAEQNDIQDE